MEKERPYKLQLEHYDSASALRRGSAGLVTGNKTLKNRSRSVIVKLQVPRNSPTANRKSIADGMKYVCNYCELMMSLYITFCVCLCL